VHHQPPRSAYPLLGLKIDLAADPATLVRVGVPTLEDSQIELKEEVLAGDVLKVLGRSKGDVVFDPLPRVQQHILECLLRLGIGDDERRPHLEEHHSEPLHILPQRRAVGNLAHRQRLFTLVVHCNAQPAAL